MPALRMDAEPRDQVDELIERTTAVERALKLRQQTPKTEAAVTKAGLARDALKALRDEVVNLRP